MLTVFYGSDAFGLQSAMDRLLAEGGDAQSVLRFEGSTIAWQALREACGARSLFAEQQRLVVKDLLNTWSARADGAGAKGTAKPTPSEFAVFATVLPDTTDLVLIEPDLSGTNRYLKPLLSLDAGVARLREFSVPKELARRETWAADSIREMVEGRRGSIDHRALHALAQRCGPDLQRASSEVDKLLCYTAPLYSIGVADVEALVADTTETKAFDLVDAVCAKNVVKVVDLAERLLSDGQAPEQILAIVSSRVRDLCLLVHAKSERVSNNTVATACGWSPYRLSQLERALAFYSLDDLHNTQAMLVSADLALKSRPSHERASLTVLTLFAAARRSDAAELATAFAY
jgi:DNA polymerase III delta subunit